MTPREARHAERLRQMIAEAHQLGHRVIAGHTEIVSSTHARGQTMNAPAPIRKPVPTDIPKAIAAICNALGLPADAPADTIRTALEACLTGPAAVEDVALRAGLSKREATMLAGMAGATIDTVHRYVANRSAMKRR